MLEPTKTAARRLPAYPPRQRWVVDAAAYIKELTSKPIGPQFARVGCNIKDPPLTRWVCGGRSSTSSRASSPCRPEHQRPTSHEVGMERAGVAAFCRLEHQRPTSHEVGMERADDCGFL
jgi:hypothetical protein